MKYTQEQTLQHGNWGDVDNIHGIIHYNIAPQSTETADTLIHEIGHGISRGMDIDFKDKEQEEHIIRTLATGYVTVFKDNPKLLKALVELIST